MVADEATQVHPQVIYLGPQMVDSPQLPRWLDRIEGQGVPAVLCVGPAPGARPQAAAPLAQRRIDLLAAEQQAWVLAGRDRRCVVVATRTELDWAMKRGQVSVWAPSKIVLDSANGPAGPVDGAALAAWFAAEMKARELVVIGAAAPAAVGAVPLRVSDEETGP